MGVQPVCMRILQPGLHSWWPHAGWNYPAFEKDAGAGFRQARVFYHDPGPIRDRTSLSAVGYSTIANIPSTAKCPAGGDQNGGRSGFLSIDSRGLVHSSYSSVGRRQPLLLTNVARSEPAWRNKQTTPANAIDIYLQFRSVLLRPGSSKERRLLARASYARALDARYCLLLGHRSTKVLRLLPAKRTKLGHCANKDRFASRNHAGLFSVVIGRGNLCKLPAKRFHLRWFSANCGKSLCP